MESFGRRVGGVLPRIPNSGRRSGRKGSALFRQRSLTLAELEDGCGPLGGMVHPRTCGTLGTRLRGATRTELSISRARPHGQPRVAKKAFEGEPHVSSPD